jgi:hypothetical protein
MFGVSYALYICPRTTDFKLYFIDTDVIIFYIRLFLYRRKNMSVDEFKKTLLKLNHEVVNFKAIENQRKAETSLRSVPSRLMIYKKALRGRYGDKNHGRYK